MDGREHFEQHDQKVLTKSKDKEELRFSFPRGADRKD